MFDADTAAEQGVHGGAGGKVILVRDETNPDDVHGMLAAQGVLTARGGKTVPRGGCGARLRHPLRGGRGEP